MDLYLGPSVGIAQTTFLLMLCEMKGWFALAPDRKRGGVGCSEMVRYYKACIVFAKSNVIMLGNLEGKFCTAFIVR